MKINASLEKQLFTKPIFIVSAPRSGSTLLFETLINSSHLWSIQNESHAIYAKFPELTFENGAQDSACLHAGHYSSPNLLKNLGLRALSLLKKHPETL
jgi:hypothetical protein